MITAQFRVQLPEDTWITDVSRQFPGATFRLLAGVRDDDGAVELGEVKADDPDAVGDAIDAHADVVWHQRLDTDGDRLLSRYRTTETSFYEFVQQSDLPPEYPLVVRDGWFDLDMTATRAELDRFRAGLTDSPLEFELQSIVGQDSTEGLLTDRQQEVLEAALRMGYFEVPRDATLEAVATELGIDKSTASGVLRRGEARMLKAHLTGSGGPRRRDE